MTFLLFVPRCNAAGFLIRQLTLKCFLWLSNSQTSLKFMHINQQSPSRYFQMSPMHCKNADLIWQQPVLTQSSTSSLGDNKLTVISVTRTFWTTRCWHTSSWVNCTVWDRKQDLTEDHCMFAQTVELSTARQKLTEDGVFAHYEKCVGQQVAAYTTLIPISVWKVCHYSYSQLCKSCRNICNKNKMILIKLTFGNA